MAKILMQAKAGGDRTKKEEKMMEIIVKHGACSMGYAWLANGDGSYVCAGGSHYLSAEEALDLYERFK